MRATSEKAVGVVSQFPALRRVSLMLHPAAANSQLPPPCYLSIVEAAAAALLATKATSVHLDVGLLYENGIDEQLVSFMGSFRAAVSSGHPIRRLEVTAHWSARRWKQLRHVEKLIVEERNRLLEDGLHIKHYYKSQQSIAQGGGGMLDEAALFMPSEEEEGSDSGSGYDS